MRILDPLIGIDVNKKNEMRLYWMMVQIAPFRFKGDNSEDLGSLELKLVNQKNDIVKYRNTGNTTFHG